jgi:hypothetical protein
LIEKHKSPIELSNTTSFLFPKILQDISAEMSMIEKMMLGESGEEFPLTGIG